MWHSIFYSFPIQLLVLHFKKNIALLAMWAVLFMIVAGGLGNVLGIPYLFLDPEYMNQVSWIGFFLMGIGFAVFTMSFHMTTYMKDGARFKFLAVIPKPFLHFCVNNSVIPLSFYLLYSYSFVKFQWDNELESRWEILQMFFGFVGGNLLAFYSMFTYFKWANKDFFVLFSDTLDKRLRKIKIPRANIFRRYKERKSIKDQVQNYFGTNLKLQYARPDLARFQTHQLLKVFYQTGNGHFYFLVGSVQGNSFSPDTCGHECHFVVFHPYHDGWGGYFLAEELVLAGDLVIILFNQLVFAKPPIEPTTCCFWNGL